jgi:hypothetical protein
VFGSTWLTVISIMMDRRVFYTPSSGWSRCPRSLMESGGLGHPANKGTIHSGLEGVNAFRAWES